MKTAYTLRLERLAHARAEDVMRRVHEHSRELAELYHDVLDVRQWLESLPTPEDAEERFERQEELFDRTARIELLRQVETLAGHVFGDYSKVSPEAPVFPRRGKPA